MKLQWKASGGQGFALAFGLVCLMVVASARAQNADAPQEKPSATRLLTVDEGRSIAGAALGQEQPARGTKDCSALIHEISRGPEFHYPYPPSLILFPATQNFS